MSTEQLAVLLDEIASLVNKATTEDKAVLNRIMELLMQADQAIPESQKNSKDLLAQANLSVADLILDNTSDADADRDALGEIISEIAQQYKISSEATEQENDPPSPQVSSSTQRTVPDPPQPTEPIAASLLDEEAKKQAFPSPNMWMKKSFSIS